MPFKERTVISKVLIFSTDDIVNARGNLVGPAIRYLELGRELTRRGHDVHLCDPGSQEASEDDGLHLVPRKLSELSRLSNQIDVVLYNSQVMPNPHASPPGIRSICRKVPSIVDLYDPSLVESATTWREGRWTSSQAGLYSQQLNALLWSLQTGDYFLCASEVQKMYYLGFLTAVGRFNPQFNPESRIGVVPMGVPLASPTKEAGLIRRGTIQADDTVFLWPGSLLAWYDGMSAVEAFSTVADLHPEVHLVFVGAQSPSWNSPSKEFTEVFEAARASDLLGIQIHFLDWVPYSERDSIYLESDCAVLTAHGGLENSLSYRSRVLDCIWGGLPMVLTEGNELADSIARKGAGVTVRPDDPTDIAEKLEFLASSAARRRRMAGEASRLASEFHWDRVVEPLHEFCSSPSFAADKGSRFLEVLLRRKVRPDVRRTLFRSLATRAIEITAAESGVSLARRAASYFRERYGLR